MLRMYLKIALRDLLLHRGISFINIAGLALGLAGFLVICLYVQNELSYDTYNRNYQRIFRVAGVDSSGGKASEYARTPSPLAEGLRNEFPDITCTARIVRLDKVSIASGGKKFYEDRVFLSDPSLLSVFTFPLISGDPNTALSEPRSILITREAAGKYFGPSDPAGHILRLDDKYDLKVTGILKDVPPNSHLHFDFLISISSANEIEGTDFLRNPFNTSVYTYVLLDEPSRVSALQERMPAIARKYSPFLPSSSFLIQPLSAIHLHSDMGGELEPNGDVKYVYTFTAVGLLILLMACINYMNILTARYTDRTKEIGVRKVLGAGRLAIAKQFAGESTIAAALSGAIALAIVELILPAINSSIDRHLVLAFAANPEFDALFVCLVLLTGVISAGYPAFLLSSLQPSRILRKSAPGRFAGLSVLRGLIVFQFLISTGLIVSTLIIWQQMKYIRNTKVGFDRQHVIVLPLRDENARREYETLKNELLKNKNVLSASASSVLPGDVEYFTSVAWDGSDPSNTMDYICGDEDFLKTYRIELAGGQPPAGNPKGSYLLNETAVREIGWAQPLGRRFAASALSPGTVTGVVRDFNYKSLHEKIRPLFIAIEAGNANYLSVRVGAGDISSTLGSLKDTWGRVFPESPFEFFFFDTHLDGLYRSESKLAVMFNWFSALAIVIASLGLVSLSFISAVKKRKEIGIRRVFGASSASIVGLVSREFLFLVGIANICAWPLAWFAMNRWLQGFAYRINPGIGSFVIASSLILAAAMIVVASQAIRAATRNPVDSLRYE